MKKYRPSNGTEGSIFYDKYCANCIHENDIPPNRKNCNIFTKTLLYDVDDDDYPKEWCYVDGKPTCTAWVKWDWDNNGDPDDPDNPNKPIPDDPNQLMLFSEADKVLNKEMEVKV